MKQTILFSPAFTPGNSGQGILDFNALPNFNIDKLYAVINLTRNTLLYVPGTTQYGFSGYANTGTGKAIQLTANTSTHSATDTLQVFYDTAAGIESNAAAETGGHLEDISETLKLVLIELKVHSYMLQQGLYPSVREEVDQIRSDLTIMGDDSSDKAT